MHYVPAHHFEHLRNANQERDAAAANLPHHLLRTIAAHQNQHSGQHRREKHRQCLSEHVAQWKQVQEAQRKQRADITAILPDLAPNRLEIGCEVAMGYHDALGGRRRTRCEDQLCRILRENLRGGRRRGCMQIYLAQTPAGSVQSACGRRDITANQHQPRVNHPLRVAHHLGGGAVVDRHDDASVEQAAPECGDPLRTRLGPDDNFIAFADGLAPQPLSEGAAGACDLVVAIAPTPVPVVVNDILRVNVSEFVKQVEQCAIDRAR